MIKMDTINDVPYQRLFDHLNVHSKYMTARSDIFTDPGKPGPRREFLNMMIQH